MNIRRWFAFSHPKQEGNGLSASLEELMNMRRYVSYLHNFKRKKSLSLEAGDIKSAFKGRGMELEEVRSYNFGDDIRDIDWRITARKDAPYTKIFNEEKDHEIYVWVDLSAPMLFGSKKELKSVTAAKITALLGWMALENKDRFGCVLFNGKDSWLFKPQNNRAHLLAVLKKLSAASENILTCPQSEEGAVIKSLKLLEQNAKNKATVFILSDFNFVDEALQKQLAALSKKSRLYLINIFDILEENPPKAGEYMAEYNGKRLIFDSSPKPYKQDYQTYFAAKRSGLKDFCRHFNCKLLEFRTDWAIENNLKLF